VEQAADIITMMASGAGSQGEAGDAGFCVIVLVAARVFSGVLHD